MRLHGWAFAIFMLFVPVTVPGATVFINLTTTVPMQDFYRVFIICDGVSASSCNQNALLPLIHIDKEADAADGSVPAFPAGVQDSIDNLNLDPTLWSGYITYIGLPQDSSSNVVIALQDGFVTEGEPWPFLRPESQIAADLLGGAPAQLQDLRGFFLNHLSAFTQMGSQDSQAGTFWEFSNAVNVGSLQADVPEPSTLALVGLAFGALLLRVRQPFRRSRPGPR